MNFRTTKVPKHHQSSPGTQARKHKKYYDIFGRLATFD